MKSGLLIVSIIMVVLVVFIVACVHRTSDIPTTIATDENTYAGSSTTMTIPTPSTSKIEGLEKSRWVCGSVHNHVMVSESEDDSEQRIRNLHETVDASKELGMEFIVLTEKGSVYDAGTGGRAWQDMLKECDNVSTKDFVCIYGQEVCTPEGSKEPAGHFITIGNAEYIPFSHDVQEIFNAAHDQNALVVVAHPFYKKDESPLYYYAAWDILDWEAMEVWNGVIDESDNQKALSKLYELWNKGVRRSMTGGADLKALSKGEILNRGEIESYLKGGYTCLYVEKFDRDGIKNAIREGHGYVSSGPAVKGFTINNVTMGYILLTQKNRPLSFGMDLNAYSKIKKVVLIENGLPIRVFNPGVGGFTADFSIPARKSGWYSLEVYAEEGRAFTNAIWVDVEVSGGESIAFSGQEYPEIVEMVGQSRSDIGHAIDIIESRSPSMILDDCRGDVCFLNALKISQDNAHLDCRGKAIRPKNNAETALLVVADNASIVNCNIESFKEGIVLRGSGSIVSNNTITNNSEGGSRSGRQP
jgi:parallel beta-helix repeat protein